MNATEAKQFVLGFFAELSRGEERSWNRVADDATWQLMARARDYPYATDYTKAAYRKLVLDSAATFPTGLEFRITGAIAEGDRVALEAESYGQTREAGCTTTGTTCSCSSGRRIKTVREYLDTGHVTDVLGTLRIAP